MARPDYSPTAAGILASLGVKGATKSGGAGNDSRLPVLNNEGLLDVSFLPISSIMASFTIPALDNTAYVDKNAGWDDPSYIPNGSIAAPFRSLDAAAASSAGFSNFIVASGDYGDASPVFHTTSSIIRIFSTGTAKFNALNLSGYSAAAKILLNNISVTTYLRFGTYYSCSVLLTGIGTVGTLQGIVDDASDPDITTRYLQEAAIGPSFIVESFENVGNITYLAVSSRVVNSSTIVPGKTVKDATDTLGKRRIRIPKFSTNDSGIHADSTEDVEITGDSGGVLGYELHNIAQLGTSLAEAANATFYKEGDSPEFSKLTTEDVEANNLSAAGISTLSVRFGRVPVYVDLDDFLTIGDTGSSDSHAYPVIDDAEAIEYPVEDSAKG